MPRLSEDIKPVIARIQDKDKDHAHFSIRTEPLHRANDDICALAHTDALWQSLPVILPDFLSCGFRQNRVKETL